MLPLTVSSRACPPKKSGRDFQRTRFCNCKMKNGGSGTRRNCSSKGLSCPPPYKGCKIPVSGINRSLENINVVEVFYRIGYVNVSRNTRFQTCVLQRSPIIKYLTKLNKIDIGLEGMKQYS